MRKRLMEYEGQRILLMGQFIKYGKKGGYFGEDTCLVRQIFKLPENEILTQHIWLPKIRSLEKYELHKGDFIYFNAKVEAYQKGYKGRRIDLIIYKPIEYDYQLTDINILEVKKAEFIL